MMGFTGRIFCPHAAFSPIADPRRSDRYACGRPSAAALTENKTYDP
jgi:hypothetical protein